MLKYHLRKSHLQGLTDKYLAQVEEVYSYDLEEVLEMMAKEEPLLNVDQARLGLATFCKVFKVGVKEGSGFNLPWFKMQPAITGTFDDSDSGWNPHRNTVEMGLSLSQEVSELLTHIQVQKQEPQTNLPVINEVLDISTGSKDANISASGAVKIEGARLKIAGTDGGNGVYFVASDGTETKVTGAFIENKPSQIIITTPDLTVGGKYTLKVVTQYSTGAILKTPRSGRFETILTVI